MEVIKKQDGVWKFYLDEGSLQSAVFYKDGIPANLQEKIIINDNISDDSDEITISKSDEEIAIKEVSDDEIAITENSEDFSKELEKDMEELEIKNETEQMMRLTNFHERKFLQFLYKSFGYINTLIK